MNLVDADAIIAEFKRRKEKVEHLEKLYGRSKSSIIKITIYSELINYINEQI